MGIMKEKMLAIVICIIASINAATQPSGVPTVMTLTGDLTKAMSVRNQVSRTNVQAFVTAVQRLNFPDIETVHQNIPGNPVQSYTVIKGDPLLPLIVKAKITNATLKESGSRRSSDIPSKVRTNVKKMGMIKNRADENNDEVGHLIGYQNGGPSELYNFAPQPRRLNRGTNDQFMMAPSLWYISEGLYNDFVKNTGNWVEQTVVVHYDLPRTMRPVGFSTNEVLYYADGSLRQRSVDYYYSNDPTASGSEH